MQMTLGSNPEFHQIQHIQKYITAELEQFSYRTSPLQTDTFPEPHLKCRPNSSHNNIRNSSSGLLREDVETYHFQFTSDMKDIIKIDDQASNDDDILRQ